MTGVLEAEHMPTLKDVGFTGGRDNFGAFCARIFSSDEPRFLRTEQGNLVVFRHADLRAFGTAPQVGNVPPAILYPGPFQSKPGDTPAPGSQVARVIANQVFTANAPIHGPARKILTNWLGPKQVALLEGLTRETVEAIIDGVVDGDEIDFVAVFAEALTTNFWAALLHMTREECDAVRHCAHEMTRLFYLTRDVRDTEALDRAFGDYASLLNQAADRGLARHDPLMIDLARQLATLNFEDDPRGAGLVPKTVGDFLAGNLVDGFHTAAVASANAIYTLVQHPEGMNAVSAEPSLLPRAIAESLRLESPIIFLKRYVLEDFAYDGLKIPAGSQMVMLWAAGNRDPKAFPQPERFDVSRSHAGLTTFGSGIHICPGRHVGLMMARVLIECLDENGIQLEPIKASAQWIPDHMLAQLAYFPLRVWRR